MTISLSLSFRPDPQAPAPRRDARDANGRRVHTQYPVTCVECVVSHDVADPCPSCGGSSSLPASILRPTFGWRG